MFHHRWYWPGALSAQIGIKDNKIVELGPNLKTTGAVVYNFAGFTIAPKRWTG